MSGIGPVGQAVAANVEALRKARGLSMPGLSARLAELGRPMLPSVLHRQSQGQRRVDVDDLEALARVFGVAPERLLGPPGTAAGEDHPAVTAARALADRLAALVTADSPEAAERARGYAVRALRRAQLETEELLDTSAPAAQTYGRANPATGGTYGQRNTAADATS